MTHRGGAELPDCLGRQARRTGLRNEILDPVAVAMTGVAVRLAFLGAFLPRSAKGARWSRRRVPTAGAPRGPPTRSSRSTPGCVRSPQSRPVPKRPGRVERALYLVVRNLDELRPAVGTRGCGWKQALQAFAIYFAGRIPHHDRHDHLRRRSDASSTESRAAQAAAGGWVGRGRGTAT
jgi:hypothetical protein